MYKSWRVASFGPRPSAHTRLSRISCRNPRRSCRGGCSTLRCSAGDGRGRFKLMVRLRRGKADHPARRPTAHLRLMAPSTMQGFLPRHHVFRQGRMSGGSCDRSCSHAKNLTNDRRFRAGHIANRAAQHRIPMLRARRAPPASRHPRASRITSSLTFARAFAGARGHHSDHRLRRSHNLRRRPTTPGDRVSNPAGSVCTSTESTAGRSRTIGVQLSPPSASVDLAARRAEVDAARVERVDRHRVAQDVDVAVLLRQPFGQRFPLVAAGAAAVDAQLAVGRDSARESLLIGTT